MKLYCLIIVLCGLVCTIILSPGCKKPPQPNYSDTGDLEAREITYSPTPVIIGKDNTVYLKVANVGDTNVKGYVSFTIVCPSVNYIGYSKGNVQVLKGSIVTETHDYWHPIYPGDYQITCTASANNDMNPLNNSKSSVVSVSSPPPSSLPPPQVTVPFNPDANPIVPIVGGNPQGGFPGVQIGGGPSIRGGMTR